MFCHIDTHVKQADIKFLCLGRFNANRDLFQLRKNHEVFAPLASTVKKRRLSLNEIIYLLERIHLKNCRKRQQSMKITHSCTLYKCGRSIFKDARDI